MDYEKRYSDALERARYYHSKDYMLINSAVENIFPELKESEDKRIKREILELVSIAGNGNQFEEIKDWIKLQDEKEILIADQNKMDYEQKYKAALSWMQSLYKGLHGATKEDAEHYFPELAESEDERIRKDIISYLRNEKIVKRYISDIEIDKWIAWLEKQGNPLDAAKVIAWLEANIINYEYYVKWFKQDFKL